MGLTNGQYTIPFQFLLPTGLPSSFEYIDETINCSIVYYGEVKIKKLGGSEIKFTKAFIIRQPTSTFNYPQQQISSGEISNCCSSAGNAAFKVSVNGSGFSWGSMAKFYLEIDNTKCSLAANSAKITLIQKINITNISGDIEYKNKNISHMSIPLFCGPNEIKSQNIDFLLSNIGNPTIMNSNKSNNALLYDDTSITEKLTSTVKGNLIANEYFVSVEVYYYGTRCCDGPQQLSFPIAIYPEELFTNTNQPLPKHWDPQVMTSINLNK